MRIIENPNPLDEEIIVCSECKCKYAYNKNDIHTKSGNNGILGPGFMSWCDRWVNCPNCGKRYTIKSDYGFGCENLY
jgi:hypothetical protein